MSESSYIEGRVLMYTQGHLGRPFQDNKEEVILLLASIGLTLVEKNESQLPPGNRPYRKSLPDRTFEDHIVPLLRLCGKYPTPQDQVGALRHFDRLYKDMPQRNARQVAQALKQATKQGQPPAHSELTDLFASSRRSA